MNRRGVTLAELLVTLVLLALILAVVPLALPTQAGRPASWRDDVAAARREALVTAAVRSGFHDSLGRFTAFPDGSIRADSVPLLRLGGAFDAP